MKKRLDLFIYSLQGGGAERICVLISNELVNLCYDVRLIVLTLENEKYLEDVNERVKIVCLNQKHVSNSFHSIRKYILDEKPNKIMVFSYDISLMMLLIKKLNKLDITIISRNINTLSFRVKNEKNCIKRYLTDLLLKKYYHKVDYVICQSKGMYLDLIENYKFNDKKIKIINNHVSNDFVNAWTRNMNCNNKEILFVGRVEKQKGLDLLIEAFNKCNNHDDEVTLRIVGNGTLVDKIQEKVSCLNLKNKVVFQNFTKDIIEVYLQSKVVVLSSYFEGFPNVLVEAITLGKPVVSFDCPSGPREIINEGVNGFLVEYLDVDKLALAIINAINYEWDCNKIRESSKKFHVSNIMKEYVEVISKI